MESEDKTGLTVHDQPEVILDAPGFHDGFIRVPLVGVEIERLDQLERNVLKQRRELRTPVDDGGMRNPDIHNGAQNQGDIPERALTHVEHRQRRQNGMHRIVHPFEMVLPESWDMEGAVTATGFGTKWKGRISCRSTGNLSNTCGRGGETWPFRRQGRPDRGACEASRALPAAGASGAN
jgi:hypothetical protein